jgi:hypothetical protein
MKNWILTILICALATGVVYHVYICDEYEVKINKIKSLQLEDKEYYINMLPGISYYRHNIDENGRIFDVSYSTTFMDKSFTFGRGVMKDVPWSEWSIEEKMYLCAYGSSGNKLNKKDMQEIKERYGDTSCKR